MTTMFSIEFFPADTADTADTADYRGFGSDF
jgi:hypothetical protein